MPSVQDSVEPYRASTFIVQKTLVKIHPSQTRDDFRLVSNICSCHDMHHERGVKTEIVMAYVIMFCYSGLSSPIITLDLIEKLFVVLIQSWYRCSLQQVVLGHPESFCHQDSGLPQQDKRMAIAVQDLEWSERIPSRHCFWQFLVFEGREQNCSFIVSRHFNSKLLQINLKIWPNP